jgi:hypothetical protein
MVMGSETRCVTIKQVHPFRSLVPHSECLVLFCFRLLDKWVHPENSTTAAWDRQLPT